jgi:hypothetical protein
MRTLKIVGIIAILLFNFQLKAQDQEKIKKTPEEKAKNQTKAINKVCNLTDEQFPKVEKIILNSNLKLNELKSSKPTQRGQKIKEFQAIKENQDAEMKQILSPEQFVKYQKLLNEQIEKIRERGKGKRDEIIENLEN